MEDWGLLDALKGTTGRSRKKTAAEKRKEAWDRLKRRQADPALAWRPEGKRTGPLRPGEGDQPYN